MSYVDQAYYDNTFHGEPVDNADFPGLSQRASEIVDEMCLYRINEGDMTSYSPDMQSRIKNAVCAEIEYLDANGGSDMDNGVDLQSAGLGRFSYSKSANAAGGTLQSMYAPRAQRILMPTGLLYRGGGF